MQRLYVSVLWEKACRQPSIIVFSNVHDEDNDNTELSKSMLYVNNF